jgi:uncharacterized protein (UPF0332 family)
MMAADRGRIIAEWQRGRLSLRSALVLTRAGLYADAISRAYYSIRHATNATLLTKGIQARTHQSAGTLLNQHLIFTHELERELLDSFNDALALRIKADYEVRRVFTASDAEPLYQRAEAFTALIRQYLVGQGFTDAELTVTLPEMPS